MDGFKLNLQHILKNLNWNVNLLLKVFVLMIVTNCQNNTINTKEDSENKKTISFFEKSKHKNISTIDRLKYLDSAFLTISKKNMDSLGLAILYNKSYCYYLLDKSDSSHYYDKYVYEKASQLKNKFYMARASRDIGIYFENKQSFDSSFFYHNISKNYFLDLKDSSQVGRRILRLGVIQKNHNDHFGAKETLTEALQYLKPSKDNNNIAIIYNELGTNNSKLFNYADAIDYYQKAIETSNSKSDMLSYKNNLAITYTDIGNYDTSTKLLGTLLSDSLLAKDSIFYARILHNYSYAKWKSGKSNLEASFVKALRIRKEKNDKLGMISSYTGMAEYYMGHLPDLSIKYLDTVIEISKQIKIPRAETDALKLLMKIAPENNIFKNRYIFLRDSLYEQELKVKTQFAKMKYDDRLKQETITDLETETFLKTAELSKQRVQKTMYLSLSCLFLFLGIVIFFFIKEKHRKEKIVGIYVTEKRISQKIHDELANDIYGVMTSIQYSVSLKKEKMLDALESVYNRTRDISHELGDINMQNFHLELKKLLSQFQTQDTAITVKGLDETLWENIQDYKKIAAYRVLNELLVNMKKHSKATLVAVSFVRNKRHLKIGYVDNGKGIGNDEKKGIGLKNAENRIHAIKGTFIFDTEPEKGTKITFLFPT